MPQTPNSFAQPNVPCSPWEDPRYQTPQRQPGQLPVAQVPMAYHQATPIPAGKPLMADEFEPCRQENKALSKFGGDVGSYKRWSERSVDHLARKRLKYHELPKITEAATTPITRADLETQQCSGVSACAVAQKLESFIMEWVTDTICNRGIQWAGGFAEQGKGFEIWRRMHKEYPRSGASIMLSKLKLSRGYPKHERVEGLTAHLDDWERCWMITEST